MKTVPDKSQIVSLTKVGKKVKKKVRLVRCVHCTVYCTKSDWKSQIRIVRSRTKHKVRSEIVSVMSSLSFKVKKNKFEIILLQKSVKQQYLEVWVHHNIKFI